MSEDAKATAATRLLAGAYKLSTAQDNIDYYRDFAKIYDEQFADGMGYMYPQVLVSAYRSYAKPDDLPVLDIGCGTGLVGAMLELPSDQIDGVDVSQEMLDAAQQKSIYGTLHRVDLTTDAADVPTRYGAVVSAGTFTFGHLGPEVLPQLLSLGRQSTLYCIGVNSEHFGQQGFSTVLDAMVQAGQISAPVFEERRIYQTSASEHADDTATILIYRKLTD